jgi:hypothetical protein
MFRSLLASVVLLAPAAMLAQGTITDGDVSFTRTDSSFDTAPDANLTGALVSAGPDHVFEHGWWFRILGGGTPEIAFGTPAVEFYGVGESFVTWEGLGGGAFDASETITVSDPTPGAVYDGASVTFELEISNPSVSSSVTVALHHLLDVDLGGTAAGDSAELFEFDPVRVIAIHDGGLDAFYSADESATGYLVRPFGAGSVRNLLNDVAVTTFDSSGLPFAAGDFTAGFRFLLTIPPGGSRAIESRLDLNLYPAHCNIGFGVFCDSFEIGSTQAWSTQP